MNRRRAARVKCQQAWNRLSGTRGRPQRAMRVGGKKFNYRPWHLTWIASNKTKIPVGKQFSHRCHNEACIEPTHGVWEDDNLNKSRNACKTASHVILPLSQGQRNVITLCPHTPTCLAPLEIHSWSDSRVSVHAQAEGSEPGSQ